MSGIIEAAAGITAAPALRGAYNATCRVDGAFDVQIEVAKLTYGPSGDITRLRHPLARKLLFQRKVPGLDIAALEIISYGCQRHVRESGNRSARSIWNSRHRNADRQRRTAYR